MLKRFEDLTQRELFKFAGANGFPITADKRKQLEREYNKARDRGLITDDAKKMNLQLARIPFLSEEYLAA